MIEYQGKTGFIWFTGIVEDRNDPLFLNRVRVRIHGAHSYDKQKIATTDLPWAEVMMPTTSPSLSGLGTTTHGLVEGSTVMGFYRDHLNMQDPIIIGSFVGIPQTYHRIDETIDDNGTRRFQQISRTTTEGFNDPRLDTESSYKGTPDGAGPDHINRNYGLTLALDKSPRRPGETTGELYPKTSYVGSSDVNLLARGDITTYPVITLADGEGGDDDAGFRGRRETGDTNGYLNQEGERDNTPNWLGNIDGYINPTYPFNHVHETESGHIIELDDTPDYERIHLYHRTGTRIEIQKDGDYIEKVVRDKYSVVLGNDFVTITGDVVVNVTGNSYVNTTGNTTLTTGGNTSVTTTGNTLVDTTGTTTVNSTGNTDVTTPETLITSNVKIDGTLNVTGAQTNDSTITAEDEVTGKGVELSTHTHTISSGSSAARLRNPINLYKYKYGSI